MPLRHVQAIPDSTPHMCNIFCKEEVPCARRLVVRYAGRALQAAAARVGSPDDGAVQAKDCKAKNR